MKLSGSNWESSVVSPEVVLKKIRPGMSIFLSTGVAEPRTMVRQIMGSKAKNLEDLELVQLVSFGEAISLEALKSKNFRLKTFFRFSIKLKLPRNTRIWGPYPTGLTAR
jgi:acyl-CoA hydrolase